MKLGDGIHLTLPHPSPEPNSLSNRSMNSLGSHEILEALSLDLSAKFDKRYKPK